jgi:hypothetical protein
MPFEPCFNLNKMDDRSFRGAVSGMGFAYCDFTRRVNVAGVSRRPQASEPVPLEAAAVVAHDAD